MECKLTTTRPLSCSFFVQVVFVHGQLRRCWWSTVFSNIVLFSVNDRCRIGGRQESGRGRSFKRHAILILEAAWRGRMRDCWNESQSKAGNQWVEYKLGEERGGGIAVLPNIWNDQHRLREDERHVVPMKVIWSTSRKNVVGCLPRGTLSNAVRNPWTTIPLLSLGIGTFPL